MERFGDRIAYAVTMNEPNLTRLLSWLNLPDFIRDVERATLEACSREAGVPTYRLANVMLPEEMDAFADGMSAGHVAAREAIRARRADLPVGMSLAIMDDVVVGDDPTVRDRKRAEVYERWLELAKDDDFIGVQNYERIPYDGTRSGPAPGGRRGQPDGLRDRAAVTGRLGPLRARSHRPAGPGHRARHEHRRRPPARGVHRARRWPGCST